MEEAFSEVITVEEEIEGGVGLGEVLVEEEEVEVDSIMGYYV